jgi:hypothetical protein
MGDSYDGNVSLTRKMEDDEIRELRIVLLPYFHISGGEVEDITDFLDYAFAMISNSKTIDYIVQELLGMEMEFCGQEIANKVGKELSTFVAKLNTTTTGTTATTRPTAQTTDHCAKHKRF